MFIALYGINNIGKSTQALRLVQRLKQNGYDAVYVKYPVYEVNPSGTYLNHLLRENGVQTLPEEELQIWFTLNRYQFEPTLHQWLKEGKIVVAEDYIGTGMAWGSVKGAHLRWLEYLNIGLLKEDLAILLEGKRYKHAKEKGHIHETNDALVENCRLAFQGLAKRYGWQTLKMPESKEAAEEALWKIVALHLPSVGH